VCWGGVHQRTRPPFEPACRPVQPTRRIGSERQMTNINVGSD
jgi:hypothetical protein